MLAKDTIIDVWSIRNYFGKALQDQEKLEHDILGRQCHMMIRLL